MSWPVVILAGGLATRLRPITETIPKALIDVNGRPFAEHQIEWLRRQGIERIVFSIAYKGEMIQQTLGDGRRWDVSLEYVFDGSQRLGTGGALKRAQPMAGDTFFVLYGDSYLDCDLGAIARQFIESGRAGLMTVFQNDDLFDRSNVLFVDGEILRYDKRHRVSDMRHIDYGLGVLTARALADFPDTRAFDLSEVYQRLLADGNLAAAEVDRRFYEIGSPEGLEETRAFLAVREAR